MPDEVRGERGPIAYRDAARELVAAFPELGPAHEEYVEWWADEEHPEGPGHYIAFGEVLQPYLRGLLSLPEGTPGRDELLKRVLDFGERLMAGEPADLAIDAVAVTVAGYAGGRELVERLGGPEMRRWFDMFASDDPCGGDPDFLDLHGIRDLLADQLPTVSVTEIAGITTCGARDLPSLAAAQATEEGAVAIGTYGFSHLFAVFRAGDVGAAERDLEQLARDLAEWAGGEEPRGDPGAGFWRVPLGERVWQLNRPGETHGRLHRDPWVGARFGPVAGRLLEVVRGRRGRL